MNKWMGKVIVNGLKNKISFVLGLSLLAWTLVACIPARQTVSPTKDLNGNSTAPVIPPTPTLSATITPTPTVAADNKHFVAPSGNDKDTGTIDHPWLTIQYAADHVHPGDTIFLRKGTFTENIQIKTSGKADAPITLSAYPGEEAVIDGGSDMAIYASGAVSYWILDHLTIKSGGRYTLRLGWWGDPLTDHWIVRNNKLFGANFVMGTNHLFENNDIDGSGYSGINGDAGITEGGDSNHNIYRGNTIHDFTQKEARGIWSQGKTHDSLFENNTISNITDNSGSAKGQCIDLDGAGQVEWRQTIRGNHVFNCNYIGIQLENVFDSVVENNLVTNAFSGGIVVISYNSDTGCKTGGESNQYGDKNGSGDCRGLDLHNSILQNILYNAGEVGGIISYASSGVNMYNNLVYGSGVALYMNDAPPFSKNWDVRGNIFSNNKRVEISINDPACFSKLDNNLFYHPANNLFFEIRKPADVFYGFNTWQENTKLDLKSIKADPLFVNPAKLDFHIQEKSPAIGAGVNLNLATDFDGKTRPSGSPSDIGPYQFNVLK